MDLTKRQTRAGTVKNFVIKNITLFILLGMVLIGALCTESFLSTANIKNVLRQVSINGVLAAGFTMVFLADGFDLSMGSIVSALRCGFGWHAQLNAQSDSGRAFCFGIGRALWRMAMDF